MVFSWEGSSCVTGTLQPQGTSNSREYMSPWYHQLLLRLLSSIEAQRCRFCSRTLSDMGPYSSSSSSLSHSSHSLSLSRKSLLRKLIIHKCLSRGLLPAKHMEPFDVFVISPGSLSTQNLCSCSSFCLKYDASHRPTSYFFHSDLSSLYDYSHFCIHSDVCSLFLCSNYYRITYCLPLFILITIIALIKMQDPCWRISLKKKKRLLP